MKKKFLFSMMCLMALVSQAQYSSSVRGYVDLGLPSGTLWKATNESGYYKSTDAVAKFGSNMPTQEQWTELRDYCSWVYDGHGFKVTGGNGNFIILPFEGCYSYQYGFVGTYYVGKYGYYLSYSPENTDQVWEFELYGRDNTKEFRKISGSDTGYSVRLVQKP